MTRSTMRATKMDLLGRSYVGRQRINKRRLRIAKLYAYDNLSQAKIAEIEDICQTGVSKALREFLVGRCWWTSGRVSRWQIRNKLEGK